MCRSFRTLNGTIKSMRASDSACKLKIIKENERRKSRRPGIKRRHNLTSCVGYEDADERSIDGWEV